MLQNTIKRLMLIKQYFFFSMKCILARQIAVHQATLVDVRMIRTNCVNYATALWFRIVMSVIEENIEELILIIMKCVANLNVYVTVVSLVIIRIDRFVHIYDDLYLIFIVTELQLNDDIFSAWSKMDS